MFFSGSFYFPFQKEQDEQGRQSGNRRQHPVYQKLPISRGGIDGIEIGPLGIVPAPAKGASCKHADQAAQKDFQDIIETLHAFFLLDEKGRSFALCGLRLSKKP